MALRQSTQTILQVAHQTRSAPQSDPGTFEHFLVRSGRLTNADMMRLLAVRHRQNGDTLDIIETMGLLSRTQLSRAQAEWLRERFVDLDRDPISPTHLLRFGAARALQTGLLPWRQRNGFTVILATSADQFDVHKSELEACFGPVRRGFACPREMTDAIIELQGHALCTRAENRVSDFNSCRTIPFQRLKPILWGVVITLGLLLFFAPALVVGVLACWAILTLIMNTALKVISAVFFLRRSKQNRKSHKNDPLPGQMPKVSILVPLFKENEIATQLVTRLKRLDYPKGLLDVILVVEQDDKTTQTTLDRTSLPTWIRTLAVPQGSIKTKPRAMNYALDHCRGSIIGVYDAEDAPDPDQLKQVVRRFANAAPDVACLQGTLDFYNARANWLSRCFSVEYATWFRIVLPGLQKLNLPVPLGGTTLFFRREILKELGGWDAHNVTEDADLGIRLARFGYKTELLPTITYEEANCRAWPWVRQRSRWLKGYAVTWAVHMRDPRKLLNDLGAWKFFGVQLLFAGTLSQFLLAPILWTFWLGLFALPHPLSGVLPHSAFIALGIIFFTSEILSIAVGMLAVSGPNHRHLMKWVPTLHFYFPLGAMAGYKGVFELLNKPFYWDKTQHGVSHKDHHDVEVIPKLQTSNVSQTPDLNAASQLHTRLLRRGSRSY